MKISIVRILFGLFCITFGFAVTLQSEQINTKTNSLLTPQMLSLEYNNPLLTPSLSGNSLVIPRIPEKTTKTLIVVINPKEVYAEIQMTPVDTNKFNIKITIGSKEGLKNKQNAETYEFEIKTNETKTSQNTKNKSSLKIKLQPQIKLPTIN
jgi:hypothetical protein